MIHITQVRTDIDDVLLAQLETALTSEELARAARFRQRADRRRHVVARVASKMLLADRLAQWNRGQTPISPAATVADSARHAGGNRGLSPVFDLRFDIGPHGKPALRAGSHDALHFNLSHSGDLALIAIAPVPVGIDVERDTPADAQALADAWFSPAERTRLARGEADFLTLWTEREAILKAAGTGLAGEPDVARHAVASLDVAAPYRAAVAVDGAMLPHTLTALDANDLAARVTLRAIARASDAACTAH